MVSVLDSEATFAAVDPAEAVARTRDAFLRHAAGEWEMPPKLYVDVASNGDFRAMPARGDGLAIVKWVTSFPGNLARGLPVVAGARLVSSDETGELLAILDTAAVTSLRTGAAAAVSAQALARSDARSVGIVGCGVNGSWAARCLAAVGYGPGICADIRPEAAGDPRLRTRLADWNDRGGGRSGHRRDGDAGRRTRGDHGADSTRDSSRRARGGCHGKVRSRPR